MHPLVCELSYNKEKTEDFIPSQACQLLFLERRENSNLYESINAHKPFRPQAGQLVPIMLRKVLTFHLGTDRSYFSQPGRGQVPLDRPLRITTHGPSLHQHMTALLSLVAVDQGGDLAAYGSTHACLSPLITSTVHVYATNYTLLVTR